LDTGGASAPEVGNLPVALTSLVGRQRELQKLDTLLRGSRLVTLAGTGGSGKTRLGLALAESSRAKFRHGAWWVDLASVTGRGLIAGTVASALGISQSPGQDTAATVARHLRPQAALLVFDNCEQVAADCAELIERLLRSCPDLTVVATSREVLGIPGERVFRVDGLRLPAHDDDAAEAVELFTERARAMTPDFSISPADRPAVARLCRQLDGLPLAIELAAARVGILGAAESARRLGRDARDARMLRHPSRTAPARHQTLQATLDWSYRLLTGVEQTLFRRLSSFSGSFTLAAAETVAAGDCVEAGDVVGLIAALAGKSLVLVAEQGAEYRYRMLETICQYGKRKLADSGEEPAAFAAHATFYLRLAEQAHAGLEGADQACWLNRLEMEHDNLRTVLRRTLSEEAEGTDAGPDPDQAAVGARVAVLLWPFWYRRGYYHEARAWLERAATAALSEPVAAPVRAAALTGAGVLAFLQCDYLVAAERLSKARALYEEEGNQVGLATALQRLGSIAREEGRYTDARKLHEESLAIWAELDDAAGVAASQDYLGFAAWLAGDAVRAVDLCGQAVAAFRAAGLRQETAAALINQGVAAHLSGDSQRGAALLQASLEIATQLGYQEGIAWALHELAVIIADDDPAATTDMLAESLEIHVGLGDRWRMASVVETTAELVVAPTDPPLAAMLLGATAGLRNGLGTPIPPAERPAHDRCVRMLREAMGPGRFRSAWQQGELMQLAELVDLALRAIKTVQDSSPWAPGADRPSAGQAGEHGLTERELEVLRLLSQGRTNREIGAELLISTGTAGVHVSNILRKLGVSSRVQAAGVAHRLGLGLGTERRLSLDSRLCQLD
jgi:predicted ATPase/DNA-binding CsgD family transcriptional regulator